MRKIYLYKPPEGEPPFHKFLTTMEPKMRGKLEHGLGCLAMFPEYMSEPHVKHFSIARYSRLYEYRERIRILVRIIFTLDTNGNIIILHPFVKKNDRNTMQALEASLRMLGEIQENPEQLVELWAREEVCRR